MDAEILTDLIARAKRRDPAAYDALVEEYGSRLYGYFYRLTGSQHDAEDLLQELFVRLVRMIGKYQHQGRFEGWLFRIAMNLVRDRVRQQKKSKSAGLIPQAQTTTETGDPLADICDSSAEQPQEALHRAEQIDRMQQAIEQLPEFEREVIFMRHFSQMSFREIAEATGVPLGTALARAHRGLARLRSLMEDHME
ncbi:MAG: RNA polymerase sigma factor [Planctomycetota bacterium]|nr:MAG: RNA polymerase sigma factor [Planctomycetota bacterium]